VVWPLVGRDHELGSVAELLSDGAVGGVALVGAAGVGKTRLAAEASRLAGSRGHAVAWVRATDSAAAIPFGPFSALLPAPRSEPAAGAELLALAREAVVRSAAGRRLVLCVDDAHLLDHGSAALVQELAAAGEAFVVLTVRREERAADPVRALWCDRLCAPVELEALTRAVVERLLPDALGGPVDRLTVGALWESTRGNALFLHELVRYGVERGALSQVGGIWRRRGALGAGMRLAELIDARLEELGSSQRRVLELVAVAAPLDAGVLEPGERVVLDTLELQGYVERRTAARRRTVDVAHPLYGEILRRRLGGGRLAAIQRRLADAVEARGARRRDDELRVAAWRLESGAGAAPELFVRAAGRALAAADWALAERFAAAAVQARGGFAARAALGRALTGGGRPEEAARVLGEAGPRVATQLTPREREVALLAATGQSSRQIARRLVVSVRTVDGHLQHAYRKLGVTGRHDLSRVLTPAAE
jgi:DNA-binding CsgD family transcriptional regulator